MNAPQDRLNILLKAKPNSWLALSEDESTLVGYGSTYAEAVEAAERNGVADPLLIRTPPAWIPLACHLASIL